MTIIEAPNIEFELKGQRMGRDEVEGYRAIFEKLELPQNGPHDAFHAARVLIVGGTLGRLVEKTSGRKVNLTAIEITSVIHDSQRQRDDDRDLGHGHRAARWAEVNLKDVLDNASLLKVINLCIFHAVPDALKLVPKGLLGPLKLLELAIMKDADALDRHRNGGDLNENFLRLGLSFNLKGLAKELFERTEARREEGLDPLTIVLKEAMDIDLVIE